ncbi:MAG: hypothetical protein KGL39_40610 [Patescibacteria group bacterium]|nr:hypothetical protein [Patescibacteria group bacterium]
MNEESLKELEATRGSQNNIKTDKAEYPMMLVQAGVLLDLAFIRVTKARARAKSVEAERALFLRANPPAGVKVTEAVIESALTLDPDTVKTKKELDEAEMEFFSAKTGYEVKMAATRLLASIKTEA